MDLLTNIFRGLIGLGGLIAILYLFSQNRKAINWRLVGGGVLLQIFLSVLILKVDGFTIGSFYIPGPKDVFASIASFFIYIIKWSEEGAKFMFGQIAGPKAAEYVFAWRVLPTILFYSALSAVLFHFGILQKIVYGIAWLLSRTMGLSGPESLAAAANIFIGQTEAPLIVRPYLATMSRSEIMCLMSGGMATIAGGVFAAYVGFLGGDSDAEKVEIARHLLAASLMSAPAAIVTAKILIPETETQDLGKLEKIQTKTSSNILDAIATGTSDGLKLAVNVAAMLIVFTSLVFMLNWVLLNTIGDWTGLNEMVVASTNGRSEGLTFSYLLGLVFAPLAWLLGTPAVDMTLIGELLGQKTIINEFVAYSTMGEMERAGVVLQEKSRIIALYALCGFSNLASVGIQIGGIGALAPEQRKTLTELGFLALLSGSIACFLTATIAGMLF